MKPGRMHEWLRPIVGAALLLGGAAGLAYLVISSYRRAEPDAFVSVQDQNRLPAASAADRRVESPGTRADATPPQNTVSARPTAPFTGTPIVAPPRPLASAPNPARDADPLEEAEDHSGCAAIEAEQHEIERALHKQYSPEEGRYMQRRLRELAAQSVKRKCAN